MSKTQQWPEVVNNTHHAWTPPDTVSNIAVHLYVPITKCASTYLRNASPAPEFDSGTWRWVSNTTAPVPDRRKVHWFVVLRDPWSRWMSGATHWLSHRREWSERIDWVIETIEPDVHTCPQHEFLSDVDLDRTVFMHYQSDIGEHAWLQQWRLQDPPRERYNITERTDIRQALQHRLIPAQIQRIKDYYHQDYELIRTARFV